MTWSIRSAGPKDASLLSLVGSATFLETFASVHTGDEILAHCGNEHSAAYYARLLNMDCDCWILETARTKTPVGYAVLTSPELPGQAEGDLELKRIYVLSRFHGTGAGAELLRRAVARAHGRGAARLLLSVYSENGRAIAFYEKKGFEKIGDHRFFVGDTGYLDFVFALPLGGEQDG
jgi:ribosomal protein S18 acetylase RimI-like enzyme